MLKIAYYQNYCINSNQISHSDKDHQMTFVCGLNMRISITNPRWQTTAILEESPYLRNGLTDHHEICHDDAGWPSWPFRPSDFRPEVEIRQFDTCALKNDTVGQIEYVAPQIQCVCVCVCDCVCVCVTVCVCVCVCWHCALYRFLYELIMGSADTTVHWTYF